LLNRKAVTRYTKNTSGKAFLKREDLFEFAELAIERLQKEIPSRVDIMITDDERVIVNEFESLEATYYSSKGSSNEESETQNFLRLYWIKKLRQIMKFCN
jgi:hypothetical protein